LHFALNLTPFLIFTLPGSGLYHESSHNSRLRFVLISHDIIKNIERLTEAAGLLSGFENRTKEKNAGR